MFIALVLSVAFQVATLAGAEAPAIGADLSVEALSAEEDTSTVDLSQPGPRSWVAFQYLNDNGPAGPDASRATTHGLDDLVTTSLWLQWNRELKRGTVASEISLNVLTNRKQGYRTDLFRAQIIRRLDFGGVRVGAGLGIAATGDFGGGFIQNRYHAYIDAPQVELPYLSRGVSPLIRLSVASRRVTWATVSSGTYADLTHAFGSGPSGSRIGAYASFVEPALGVFEIRLDQAFVHHYDLNAWTEPMFGSGWASSVTAAARARAIGVALRISRNEFGVDDLPQFGLILLVGEGPLRSVFPN